MQLWCTEMFITTARRSYASAVLEVVILSVCPSVTRVLYCFVTNPKNLPATFLYHILNTPNMQSKTGFPSSHQLKSYVAPKSRLKFAARCPVSSCWPSCYFNVFWATVYKTVRPIMLSDRRLVVPVLSCLSVTLVYCGQKVASVQATLCSMVIQLTHNFRPMSVVAKRLYGLRCHSVQR